MAALLRQWMKLKKQKKSTQHTDNFRQVPDDCSPNTAMGKARNKAQRRPAVQDHLFGLFDVTSLHVWCHKFTCLMWQVYVCLFDVTSLHVWCGKFTYVYLMWQVYMLVWCGKFTHVCLIWQVYLCMLDVASLHMLIWCGKFTCVCIWLTSGCNFIEGTPHCKQIMTCFSMSKQGWKFQLWGKH